MGFADWTFYTVGSPVLALSTSPSAPVGTQWLHMGMGSGAQVVAVPKDPPYPHAGVTHGFLRTLLRYDDTGLRSQAGLLCMCNQDNLLAWQGGKGYGAVLDNHVADGTRMIKLVRFDNGIYDLALGGAILAVSLANLAWSLNTLHAMELSWRLEPSPPDRIVLTVRLGSASDFSDLAPVEQLADIPITGTVFTHAATVGVYAAPWNSTNQHIYLDQTSLGTLP